MDRGNDTAALFALLNTKKTRRAVEGVPAATGPGLLHAVLWCLGFAVILVAGRVLVPSLGGVWALIALAAMLVIGRFWSRRFGIRATTIEGTTAPVKPDCPCARRHRSVATALLCVDAALALRCRKTTTCPVPGFGA